MEYYYAKLRKIDDTLRRLDAEVPFIGKKQFSYNIVGLILKELSNMWGFPSVHNEKVFALVEYYKLHEKGFPHLRSPGVDLRRTQEHTVEVLKTELREKEQDVDSEKPEQPTSQDNGEVLIPQCMSTFGYYDECGEPEGDTGVDILYCPCVGSPP